MPPSTLIPVQASTHLPAPREEAEAASRLRAGLDPTAVSRRSPVGERGSLISTSVGRLGILPYFATKRDNRANYSVAESCVPFLPKKIMHTRLETINKIYERFSR